MHKIREFILILIVGGFIYMIINSTNNNIPKIPLRDFFKNAEKSSFQISRDGKHIAFMKPWKNRMNVYVMKIGDEKELRLTSSTERDIYGYVWLNNNRVGYIKDKGGDENIHVYGVSIDGTNEIDLTPYENIQARLIDDLEEDLAGTKEGVAGATKRNSIDLS